MFLSVDPVTAYSNPIDQFHRYRYANNNPYKFTDPDGRLVLNAIGGGIGAVVGGVGGGIISYISSGGDLKQTLAGAAGGAVGGAITGATFGAGSSIGAVAAAGVVGGLVGEGTAQTVGNALDHGSDVSSYEYSAGRLAVGGATGALGAVTGGLMDDLARASMNPLQRAAVTELGLSPVNTAAALASNVAETGSAWGTNTSGPQVTVGPIEQLPPPPPIDRND